MIFPCHSNAGGTTFWLTEPVNWKGSAISGSKNINKTFKGWKSRDERSIERTQRQQKPQKRRNLDQYKPFSQTISGYDDRTETSDSSRWASRPMSARTIDFTGSKFQPGHVNAGATATCDISRFLPRKNGSCDVTGHMVLSVNTELGKSIWPPW